MKTDYHNQHSSKHKAALKFAERIPVFPCRADKTPYTPNGFKDATRDLSRINAYWNSYRNANPAAPTGEQSGFFVLDVDRDKWGFGSLEALEAEHGELPATFTVKTGGGGLHYYFRLPPGIEIRNSAGKLGHGLDVRGEGGYVLLPGSTTEGTYEVLERLPIAEAPAWLVELIREPAECAMAHRPPRRRNAVVNPNTDGPPIPEGERDDTLTSIAGKLHDGTRALPDLEAELLEINEARCVPPLPERQVRKIARSIHQRTPCKPSAPKPNAETLEALDAIETLMWRLEWRGMGGKSERDIVVELIRLGRRCGQLIASGVRISVGIRALALAAGVSKPTVIKALRRLRQAGILRRDDANRSGTKAGAIVLLIPRANLYHSNHQGGYRTKEEASGKPLRAPFTAPRLRWSAPRFDRVGDEIIRTTILRLGKTAGAVLDALEALGGSATVEELAAVLEVKRPRDLRRRAISRLEDAGVIACAGDTVSLAADWLEALNRDRERAGELEAHRRDMRRYNDESEAYRNRHKVKTDHAPSHDEMQARRDDLPNLRREAIKAAIARLFSERPEYRSRRVGHITCALVNMGYIGPDFPRGADGVPKDAEVESLLDGVAA